VHRFTDSPSLGKEASLLPVFRDPPPPKHRDKFHSSLHTGTTVIDCLVPIGRGQSMVVAGGRDCGKTTLALDALRSQVEFGTGVHCIYAVLGNQGEGDDAGEAPEGGGGGGGAVYERNFVDSRVETVKKYLTGDGNGSGSGSGLDSNFTIIDGSGLAAAEQVVAACSAMVSV
jgi:hypothetical protein